ncbi:MAG: hypothetical protein MK101_11490 [Phycisphaerales bacterium]|nr:hypothetical protein [Phycisphaerales bacterium]
MRPQDHPAERWQQIAENNTLLQAAASLDPTPSGVARLRGTYSAAEIQIALDVIAARRSAQGRLEQAEALIADSAGTQQATPAALSAWKARVLSQRCPGAPLLDAGCGIGADTRHLASVMDVRGCDALEARCWMAARYSGAPVTQKQITCIDDLDAACVHLDPARRDESGRRIRDPRQWSPNAALIQSIWATERPACIMLGPGIDLDVLAPPAGVQVAFCSIGHSLIDAAALSGTFAQGLPTRRAVRVLEGVECSGLPERPPSGPPPKEGLFLHVPDPAIERAQLLHLEAAQHGLHEPAPGLGLLLGTQAASSPWLTPWLIEGITPPRTQAMQAWLKAHDAGSVTVRTRGGAASDVDTLAKTLSGRGQTHWTVFILRLGRKKTALMASKAA